MTDQINFMHGSSIATKSEKTVVVEDLLMSTNAIGLITVADDANAAIFPTNVAIEVPSFDNEIIEACGTQGTQLSVFKTLSSQKILPKVILVRVAEGADNGETTANALAGLDILQDAITKYDTPLHLFIAPGLETKAVADALLAVSAKNKGFSLIALHAESDAEAESQRDEFNNKFCLLLYPSILKNDSDDVHIAALAAVMRVQIDHDKTIGGISKTLSNVPIDEDSAITDNVLTMDFRGEDSRANTLNNHQITTVIRRKNKFYFWGNRVPFDDPMWTFESDVRIDNLIQIMIDHYIDTHIDAVISSDELNDLELILKTKVMNYLTDKKLITKGLISFNKTENKLENLSKGKPFFGYQFGTYKPLENPVFDGLITNIFLLEALNLQTNI